MQDFCHFENHLLLDIFCKTIIQFFPTEIRKFLLFIENTFAKVYSNNESKLRKPFLLKVMSNFLLYVLFSPKILTI